jgi:hypothetical protein
MRKSTQSIFFLAFAVAILGAAVYAEVARERTLAPQPLTRIDTAGVRRLEIRCASCTTRIFAQRNGVWRMLEPYAAAANPDAVKRLLAVARTPVRTRARLTGYDPAKLGLAPPQITVILDATRIDIGGEDPIEHDRYVRIGDELMHVRDRFSARLLESPASELADPADAHGK